MFINTVRGQIMSHSKNSILAGVRDLFGRHSGRKVTHLRQAERNVRYGGKLLPKGVTDLKRTFCSLNTFFLSESLIVT